MADDEHRASRSSQPFDTDAIVDELARAVASGQPPGRGLTPFSTPFTGSEGAESFEVEPPEHPSTRPIIGPVVARGRRAVARASAPMVADLGEQVATSLNQVRQEIRELRDEQRLLRDAVAALERRLDDAAG